MANSARFLRAMLLSEKQRAYRYGMTLLCIGAFFNWLGLNEGNADPLKFIGFTCLSSGALLVCVAICMWANTPRQSDRSQPTESPSTVIEVTEPEKPPDYDSVIATATPPPCYVDAIKLSPFFLTIREMETHRGEPSEVGVTTAEVHNDSSDGKDSSIEVATISGSLRCSEEPSTRLGRMLRVSQRILRRSKSSPDSDTDRPVVHRSVSSNEPKNPAS